MAINATQLTNIDQSMNTHLLIGQTLQTGFTPPLLGTDQVSGVQTLNQLLSLQQLENIFRDQRAVNRTQLALRNEAANLNASNPDSVFGDIQAVSSDPDMVSATAGAGSTSGTYDVTVDQLAQGQRIRGDVLAADAQANINTSGGYGQLEFTVSGSTELVTFQLQGGETSRQALNEIASQINARDIGVNATVQVDESANEARLVLEGPAGADNSFTVGDSFGNAAAVTGINSPANVTQTAQNARFQVNGVQYETPTNEPAIGATGLTLDLQQTTGGSPVQIPVQAGAGQNAVEEVNGFVDQFNQTLETLRETGNPGALQSAFNLQTLARANAGELEDIGLTVGAGGELSVNQSQLDQSAAEDPGQIREAFNAGGYGFGFAQQVQNEAERAINASLAEPSAGGLLSFFGTNALPGGYGFTQNSFLAQNIGFFVNQYI